VIIKDIHIVILIGVIFLTAAAAVWGTIRFAIPNLKESLGNIVTRLTAIEGKIGNSISRQDFDKEIKRINESRTSHRFTCQQTLSGRIQELKDDLKGFDHKRDSARTEIVSRADFEAHKKAVKDDMDILFKKMDAGQVLLARLDERIQIFINANGSKPKSGG